MVFFLTSSDGLTIYLGKNKYENEDLIRCAHPEDIWFHVSDYSSAHVYLRMEVLPYESRAQGIYFDLNALPPQSVDECIQLTKANSIEGCKKSEVPIIFTPASNLLKTPDMDIGQVEFKDRSLTRIVTAHTNRAMVKALAKQRTESYPNLSLLKEQRDERELRDKRAYEKLRRKQEAEESAQEKVEEEVKTYATFMVRENMTSNKQRPSEPFM
jgi:predicted ribosome quality control (RQC) complex YloA/Tae2 family protein